MVHVTAGGSSFCIDATEVTEADFVAFVNDGPNPWVPNDAGLCSGIPGTGDFSSSPLLTAPAQSGGHPVGVAWCAARAYCAWAGKRLCRSTVLGNAEVGEFWIACSGNGVKGYGYGNALDEGACPNGEGFYPTGSVPTCTAGTPGIFDINGNRQEWIEGFGTDDAGPNVYRNVRGLGGTALCSTLHGVAHWDTSIGFRCCADPR
jgi:formylglycine-generating enzyme